ncbi:hypothetical protein UY3_17172 [Chelonia mydas]|uniref:Uncharacterized protein n=1 Tax=Chelonia mydas TaxID=8469 RepID=M7AKT9_CHEMY|nr:hypothetical protein UY3_17172 [Chelonia mydas]
MGLELSLRELEGSEKEREDHERQRDPEKELQEKQQHELTVGERRGLGDLSGDPGPAPVMAEGLNLNPGNQLAETELVSENANVLAGSGEGRLRPT